MSSKTLHWFGLTHTSERPGWLFTGVFSTAYEVRRDAEGADGRSWKDLYKDGYRVCKVDVTPTIKEAPDADKT